MLNVNFDQLEASLEILLQELKRKMLLEEASLANHEKAEDILLRQQLEAQAELVNRAKDNKDLLDKNPEAWSPIVSKFQTLMQINKLYTKEQQDDFEMVKEKINKIITLERGVIDEEFNGMIVDRGRFHAEKTGIVKTFKNWRAV